jgi:hypothetical protein
MHAVDQWVNAVAHLAVRIPPPAGRDRRLASVSDAGRPL